MVPGAIEKGMKAIPPEAKELLTRCQGSMSKSEMARRLGVDPKTVGRWIGRLGLEGRRARREQRIREAYPDGDTVALARELGMTAAALRKAAERLGVNRTELAVSRSWSKAQSHGKKRSSETAARRALAYEANKRKRERWGSEKS